MTIKRKTPMKRGGPIKSHKGKPIDRRRKPRTRSEFARIYGSRERVQWIKSFGCALCGYPGAVNAHTVTGGTGRKAGYETIVPLCDAHHRAYDEHRWPFDDEAVRDAMKSAAARLDRLWQERAA